MNDYTYDKSDIFNKLEALAMFWDITLRPTDMGQKITLSLNSGGDEAKAEFTGLLQDVILEADAWADEVVFTFALQEESQP